MRTIVRRYFWTISQRSFSSFAFNLHWVVPWPIYNVILTINLRYLFSVRESHIIQWKIKWFTNDFWIVNSKAIITYLGPGIFIEDFNSTPNSNKFVINWAYSFRISQSIILIRGNILSSLTCDNNILWMPAINLSRLILAFIEFFLISSTFYIFHYNWQILNINEFKASYIG